MNDDRIEDGYASDTDENNSSRLDDSQDRAMISRSMTPQKGLTQHMTTFADAHGSIDSADGSIHDTYMSDTVIRGSQYSQGVPGSDYPVEITRYGEMPGIPSGPPLDSSGSMGLPEIQYMQTHDPSRRSSMADPHLEFATTTTPNGYVSWTNTSAPSATTMYTMPGPGPGYQQNALMSVGQPGVPMTQPQTYSMIYDSLPRGHDLGSANMLRAGLAPNPSAYQDYAGTRGMIGSGVKQESLNRNLPTLH